MDYVQQLLQTDSRIERQQTQRVNILKQIRVWNADSTMREVAELERQKALHKLAKSDNPIQRDFAKIQIAF